MMGHRLYLLLVVAIVVSLIAVPYLFKPGPQKVPKIALNSPSRSHGNRLKTSEGVTQNGLSRTSKGGRKHGYIVALSYSGQQAAGIAALTSLQCWAGSFDLPMLIMEPLIMNTIITSVPSAKSKNTTSSLLRFGNYFDLELLNKFSRKNGYLLLAPREEFFDKAPRETILVVMKAVPREISLSERETKLIWSRKDGSKECYQGREGSRSMKTLIKQGFCVIRLIQSPHSFANTHIFSASDLKNIIFGPLPPNDVTLVFTIWRTPWYVPVPSGLATQNVPDCKSVGFKKKKAQFQPSQGLLADVKTYEDRFLGSQNSLAVMIRMERMLEFLNINPEWSVDKCLDEIVSITKKLRETNHYGRPYATLDVGKYGSKSWRVTMTRKGKNSNMEVIKNKAISTLLELYDNQWSFTEWEESFATAARGIEASGYIAAIQRVIASKAECLVLAGGGMFQDIALQGYMRNHPDKSKWCIHLVCVMDEKKVRNKIEKGDMS